MTDTTHTCVSECGSACCRTPDMRIQITLDEAETLTMIARIFGILDPPIYATEDGEMWLIMDERKGRCVFLNHSTGMCRIYKDRPNACRKFPHRPVTGCLLMPGTIGRGVAGHGIPR